MIWRESTCSRAAPANDPCLTAGGCNNKYNCFDESSATIALTTTTFNNKTGEIYDSDIELNAAAYVFTTVDGPTCSNPPPRPATNCVGTDIRNTLTHEIGHVLGLDHASDPTATMYPTAALGETSKRVLHTDDINGLCTIYPKGVAIAACATSQNPTNKTCGCGSGGEPLAGLAVALAALALYRRRTCAT